MIPSHSPFEPVTLNWQGDRYVIAADRVMAAIFVLENVITITELAQIRATGNIPIAKVSHAFAALLRFAGATATEEQVYASMFQGEHAKDAAFLAIQALMVLMVPPKKITDRFADKGDKKPGKARSASSRKRTRRRAAPANG